MNRKQRKAIKDQLTYTTEISSILNLEIVTCCSCGDVFILKTTPDEVTCPYCGVEGDNCDMPSLFYSGWNGG